MSEISQEEKRRLLKERRAAKMAGGQATNRLNKILNQGSSVNPNVTSVLDKKELPDISAKETKELSPSANEDPDTSDIDQLLSHRVSPAPQEVSDAAETGNNDQDIDKMLNSVFGGFPGNEGGGEDPITQMMKSMLQQQQNPEGEPQAENSSDKQYEEQLLKYNTYRQKQLKYRFLVVRYLCVLVNFFYHYLNFSNFQASNYSYVRDQVNLDPDYNNRQFFLVFISVEMVILSSYYLISSHRKVTENVGNDNMILKLISMAAMVVPSLKRYQLMLFTFMGYFELVNIFLGDLALIVILFGITSYVR